MYGMTSIDWNHESHGATLSPMTKRFEDRVVVITGGSDGIGHAAATRFAAEGAHVYVTGRRADRLAEAVEEIGHGVVGVPGDVANLADLDGLYARVAGDHGRVDVVFANAGISGGTPIGEITEADFDRVFATNVRGALFTVQKALPLMRPGGSIVLNGSMAGSKGLPAMSVYAATKAALRSFARSWTTDLLKTRGIRVNVVSPGIIATPGMARFAAGQPGLDGVVAQVTPLGRMGEADEVAAAVLFLASQESRFVAGVELFVDGGIVAV